MTRNQKGIILWLLLSICIGAICFPVMIIREYYQWKHYHLKKFEWDDVLRYGGVIAVGSVVNIILVNILCK